MLAARWAAAGGALAVAASTTTSAKGSSTTGGKSSVSESQERGGQAYFKKKKALWCSRTLIDTEKPELGSWLTEGVNAGRWGIGCRICCATGKSALTKWACFGVRGKSVRWCNIQRHGQSPFHLQQLGQQPTASGAGAPRTSDFRAVLEHKARGNMSDCGLPAVASGEKVQLMAWCLSEAQKDSEQACLRNAQCIAIHQDAREGVLMVRYTSVDHRLSCHAGLLGLAQDFGTKSKDVYNATLQIMRSFCTCRVPVGRLCPAGPGVFDQDLYEHIKAHIELFDADGARDEQRAARLLRGGSTVENLEHLPNLKVIVRDRTHAATRRARPKHLA